MHPGLTERMAGGANWRQIWLMSQKPSPVTAIRQTYARVITANSGCAGGPLEAAFAEIPREDFLPDPPWDIFGGNAGATLTSSEPEALYCDGLVAIDKAKGINNGQPSLHAKWICAADPIPGDIIAHVGCGGGYYSAILAALVGHNGHVHAYEIDPDVARLAARCLVVYPNITLHRVSGASSELPAADVIYVNAAASAPQGAWLAALRPGGRLIFPWSFRERGAATILITRSRDPDCPAFTARAIGRVSFIALEDEQDHRDRPVDAQSVLEIRSLQTRSSREPDGTSIAVFPAHWFSSRAPDRE